ncbi:MAG: DUF4856 domain-containing protein [Bacteroidota bacterium]
MQFSKSLLYLSLFGALCFTSCDNDDEPDMTPDDPGLQVPSTYTFTDADGNSTVSYNGQEQRLEMLSEITTYMKTGNTSGNAVDAQQLKDMYANENITWADAPGLGMTGSSKQLKSKTGAAPSGTPDPGFIAYFEGLMDGLGFVSSTTVAGNDNGGPGQAGVVVSTTNPSKQYLQDANGQEFVQLIEKGLMGAVFYNQIQLHYLGEPLQNSDNTDVVDAANGKYYTQMEHFWDEAYGYFTTATDYTPGGGNGTNRFWGRYADGREDVLGSATSISRAFRTGRAAISAGDMAERDAQIAVIRDELQKVAAGTAIHYLNDAIADFGDDALRNHVLSEAAAFMYALPFGHETIANQAQIQTWLTLIGTDFYNVSTTDILTVRDELAAAAGLSDVREDL